MKGKLKGTIASMVTTDNHNFVDIKLDTIIGAMEVDGEKFNPDSKTITGEINLRVKPVLAKKLQFGQILHFSITDEEP